MSPTIHRSLRCLTICVVICAATSARAGDFCSHGANGLASLERHAAGTDRDDDDVAWVTWCLSDDKPHVSRILAACDKILAREPKFASCYVLAAALGAPKVGDRNVFDWLAKQPLEPWKVEVTTHDHPLGLFARLGDPRGAPLIVAAWRALLPIEAKHEHDASWMNDWGTWRAHAAEAIGALGTADDAAFLAEQGKLTRDRLVSRACADAGAAITKRLAKPSP